MQAEALTPHQLADEVRQAVESNIDLDLPAEVIQAEASERDELMAPVEDFRNGPA